MKRTFLLLFSLFSLVSLHLIGYMAWHTMRAKPEQE